jgi:hypothetical protein
MGYGAFGSASVDEAGVADRIRGLLTVLSESTEPGPDDHC